MTMTADVVRIFDDARLMHGAALTLMNAGDIRDAAEKAWCATKRAADGMITARTGEEPSTSTATGRGLDRIKREDPALAEFHSLYFRRQAALHGLCFYYGICDPIEEIIDFIRDTERVIADAERYADSYGTP